MDISVLATSIAGLGSIRLGNILSFAVLWLAGGPGPGGYYVPILFQMYLLFPLMYALFRKRPIFVAAALFAMNLCWEGLLAGGFLTNQAYRLLIFRYLVYLLLGMVFYRLWESGRLSLTPFASLAALVSCILGAAYLAAINYFGFPPFAGGAGWANTSWVVTLYTGSLFYLLLAVYACRLQKKGGGFTSRVAFRVSSST